MSKYIRVIKAPVGIFETVVRELTKTFTHVDITYEKIDGTLYGVAKVLSQTPIIVLGKHAVSIQRNATEAIARKAIRRIICASDLDVNGIVDINVTQLNRTTTGAYELSATITDNDDNVVTLAGIPVNVVDTLKPIIEALDEVVIYSNIAAWDNETLAATDNTSDDLTSDVVINYYSDAKLTVPIASLADARIHLASTNGNKKMYVKYTLTDEDDNVAAPVVITVTSKSKPVITSAGNVTLAYADLAAWTDPAVTAADAYTGTNLSASVVKTYYQTDDATAIATFAEFKTYLDNTGAGNTVGHIHYNVANVDEVAAEEVSISVTVAAVA